jgi:alkanesulfonate monooxygenase SsuD/methylene tetrahydromethanopterin reductase-like flavin-dependent oxidoreductase (luciferase family)
MAKMTSTFDVLSEGRLILGMGASDHAQFWRGWGMDYPPPKERIAYLSEEIQVIKRMWQEPRANFDGKYYRLFDAVNLPKPLQDPRPPIWIGLSEGRRLMPEVVAKHADGFDLCLGSDADITERLGDIADACKRVRRDFDELTKALTVYVTVTDDPNYDHGEGIARHGRELELGAQMTAKYVQVATATTLAEGGSNAPTYRIVGSTDKISEGLEHLGRLGLDYLIIHFTSTSAPIGGDIKAVVADMEIFAAEVMPNF